MADYLPPGSCDKELKDLKQAKKDADRAFTNYESARHNMEGAGLSAGGGAVGGLVCTLATAGLGAIVCLGGAALVTFGGIKWTQSAGEALINAGEDLDEAIDKLDNAIDTLCKCLDSHMMSVPD